MSRPISWRFVLPSIHLLTCLTSYVGILIPSLQFLGILFTFVLLADLPVSLPAYVLGWKYSMIGATWIFLAGTSWWYLLGRAIEVLLLKLSRRNEPNATFFR